MIETVVEKVACEDCKDRGKAHWENHHLPEAAEGKATTGSTSHNMSQHVFSTTLQPTVSTGQEHWIARDLYHHDGGE